ncbi:uncharacterized protein LOC116265671 [Nymphaea colorata]|nr:uncharacterized protein LOC116265671 [Nymphaea colorata]
MAAVSSLPSSYCFSRISRASCRASPSLPFTISYSSSPSSLLRTLRCGVSGGSKKWTEIGGRRGSCRVQVVAEESVAPEGGEDQPSVSVPISPSDVLTMFFKAEGTMDDSASSAVRKVLEEVEGVSDLKVGLSEGIATVELTKQTTVQATGVASNLVEMIQGSGFNLQTLNLSFEDEEDIIE